MSPADEVAVGLYSAPKMAAQFGGLDPSDAEQRAVDQIGARLLERGLAKETPYRFEFHLLADRKTVNAFALPGGQIFVTRALFDRVETEGQLAGIIAHEIGHVLERHGAQHLAKAQLAQMLVGAVAVGAMDPNNPRSGAQMAALAAAGAQLVNLKYGRDDELESDRWGVELLANTGYDPRAMIEVMRILEAASDGHGRTPEFFATHPNPENRVERIEMAIKEKFPTGVPSGLEP
ncbi:MAG: M48 family metalloprotease [Phycisphaerae bacterium]|nr:M48 family metalloprotease [Phycisphaerae bacterium]